MSRVKVIEEARIYLEVVGYDKKIILNSDDDSILQKTNLLYFGGLQAFARKVEGTARELIIY